MKRLRFLRWLTRLLVGDISWGDEGCLDIDCKGAFPRALLLTVVAMVLHPGTVLRDIRGDTDDQTGP